MKLAILSRSLRSYSTRRLREAALQRNHTVKVLDTLKFAIDLQRGAPDLYFRQKPLSDYDAVLPRIGSSITYFGTAVVRQFEEMDVYCANTALGISNSRDKLRSLQVLSRHHIGIPRTTFVKDKKDVIPAIERVGGAPVVIKLIEGTQGIGVLLADTSFTASGLELLRTRLNDGTLSWNAFVARGELALHCDALHYFSFWITPIGLPKRYSTRFFLAELPAGQQADHCGGELTDSCWMSAAECLRAHEEKTMTVHYPTRKTLERLAEFDSAETLLEWARRCGERGVVCDQPAFSPELLR